MEYKMKYKIRLLDAIYSYWITDTKYYSMQSVNMFINYFFSFIKEYEIIHQSDTSKADLCICDIQMENNELLRDDEINILVSIENLPYWGNYKHYNRYNEYGDNKISIYYYNHISNIVKTDQYLAVPQIYNYINYFENNYDASRSVSFTDKKFCLIINKSNLNSKIYSLYEKIKDIGQVDHIAHYNNQILNKTCYHSEELLGIFSQYKFVICFENSYMNGYVTEKIFNCFLANTIPIYDGAPDISTFINSESYIDAIIIDDELVSKIKDISSNEEKYNELVNKTKIVPNEEIKNYNNIVERFINEKNN